MYFLAYQYFKPHTFNLMFCIMSSCPEELAILKSSSFSSQDAPFYSLG